MDITTAVVTICISILGSTALSTLIQFFVTRADKKHDRINDVDEKLEIISKRLNINERDSIRTQMLLMISDYPDNTGEIMRLAQHYFGDLEGNWYMTSMFNTWLERNEIAKPEWFDSSK